MIKTTLIYINKDDKFLFLKRDKKLNDINKDKYIGIGGHLELNESITECLYREVKEETGLNLLTHKLIGNIIFNNTKCESEEMYLYTGTLENGNLLDCDEGTFYWINKKDIMSLNLWEGDKVFLPFIINNVNESKFSLILNYDGDKLLNYKGPIYY